MTRCGCAVCERAWSTPAETHVHTCACPECHCAVEVRRPLASCPDCEAERHSKASVRLASGAYLTRDGLPCDSRGNPLSTTPEGGVK